MKLKLSFLLMFLSLSQLFGQAPVISGDTMMCPYTNGTASVVGSQTYDSYQWYFKYWFLSDEFQPIEGATNSAFTYDWMTYDQAVFKVEVTLGGQTYTSNEIQIDSYNWVPMSVSFELAPNLSINPENGSVMLCDGTSVELQLSSPFTENINWFKDGVLIPDETSTTLIVSEPGVYHVSAAPEMCPDNTASNASTPVIVESDSGCQLNVNQPNKMLISVYPNPANDLVYIKSDFGDIESVVIYSMTGQQMLRRVGHGNLTEISIADLASGIYILETLSAETIRRTKFVRQ